MAKLKIIGWDTGQKKLAMLRILKERLGLDEAGAKGMERAVSEGRTFSLDIDDADFAETLARELTETGAKVEIEGARFKEIQ